MLSRHLGWGPANTSVELVMYSQCCGGNRPLEMEETTASRLDGSIGHVYNSRGVWTGGTESPHHQLTPCSAGGGV